MIFLTGVGARYLALVIETWHPEGAFQEALRGLTVVVCGPETVLRFRSTTSGPCRTTPARSLSLIDGGPATGGFADHASPGLVIEGSMTAGLHTTAGVSLVRRRCSGGR